MKRRTHSKQDPGVKPLVHEEGHVEVDEEEGVDAQPHQLEISKHNSHFFLSKNLTWTFGSKQQAHFGNTGRRFTVQSGEI